MSDNKPGLEGGGQGGGGSLSSMSDNDSPTNYSWTETQYIVGVGPQIFRVTCTGMKPNTLHNAYLVDRIVSVDCAPLTNYNWGNPLISDINGVLIFDYKFNPVNSPYQTSTYNSGSSSGTVAIIPAGNQKFHVTSGDGNSYAQNYIQQK